MDKKVANLTDKNNKSNTKDFINKAILKHGNKYDYSKTNYVAVRVKVTITCPIHGDFQQTPESHLTPRGCFKCGYDDYNRGFTHTKQTFIEKSIKLYGDKYNYDLVDYVDQDTEVEIVCKSHGIFKQKPKYHFLRECNSCTKDKGATVYAQNIIKNFIEKAKEVYGDEYDYSLVEYVEKDVKVKILCSKHGKFEQSRSNHLRGQGCPKCGKEAKKQKKRKFTSETFREEVSKIHTLIDFSHTIYEGIDKKVTYECSLHGSQSSFAGNLLKGHGCKECWSDRRREEPGSWSYSSWGEKALISNYFDSFKVYIIRCWNEEEEFYKIGRTFVTIETRFVGKRAMPYNYEVLKIFEEEHSNTVCQIEEELKRKNKKFKYKPKITFGGMYECFSKIEYE